jgi:hypothetical protein
MERRSWVRPAFKWLFTALLVAAFNIAGSAAHADFYNPEELVLPIEDAIYESSDQSASGDVIVTANGCASCFITDSFGYAFISKDGGSTFTEVTSIEKNEWRSAEVSADGKTIAFFSIRSFFISTDSGDSFTRVDPFTANQINTGGQIQKGVLSGDGKSIFIIDRQKSILKVTYKSSLKRWTTDFTISNFNNNYVNAIATNYDGSKTYIGSSECSITRLTGSTLTLLLNTVSYYSQCLSWSQIRTSDSGNEFIGIAYVNRGRTVFMSNNGGSSLSVLLQVNGVDLAPIEAVEISPDGNSSFFSTSYGLFTQHGKNAPWMERAPHKRGVINHIRSNNDGSTLLAGYYSYFLRVFKGQPSPPSITGVSIASTSSLSVSWDAGFDAGSDSTQLLTDVFLEYSTSNTGPWTVFNDGVSGGDNGSITVTDLNNQTNYYFRIKSKNSFGTSEYSTIKSGFIYGNPSTPAGPLKLNVGTETKAHLYFYLPTDFGGAPSLTETQWQYSTNGGMTWNDSSSATFSAVNGYDVTNGVPVLIISDHTPGATLYIKSRTSNGLLWSDWSSFTEVTLYKPVLAPSNFQVTATSTTSTLTWSAPSDLGGETILYYIYKAVALNSFSSVIETTTSLSAVITGLTQGASYNYEVSAVTVRGKTSYTSYLYEVLTSRPPVKLLFERLISGTKSGSAFTVQPIIFVADASNLVVNNDSSTVVYAQVAQNGKLIGTESATVVAGRATFTNLGIKGVAGQIYELYFRAGSLQPAVYNIELEPGSPTAMRFTQKTVGGIVGVNFSQSAQIELLDSEGNGVNWDDTSTVTISTNHGFLSYTGSTTKTVVDGVASFNNFAILGTNGANAILTYSSSGKTSLQETITVTTGPASKFARIVRAQDGYIGGQFGVQPTYQILDAADNVVTTGEYFVTIAANRGTLTGQLTENSVDGIVTFKNLGIKDITAFQLVGLTVTSDGFTDYTGDSIVTLQSKPRLSWSDFYLPRDLEPFTIPEPETSTAGTFTYTSSNAGVLSISGNTATVVSSGTAVVTATFTPTDTTSFFDGETITATFTVNPGAGTLFISLSGGATAAKGVVKTMTATASASGAVTFYINGKRVPGCISVKTQSSVATCNWKPATQGSVTITALLIPGNSQISPVSASAVNMTIGRRTGRR